MDVNRGAIIRHNWSTAKQVNILVFGTFSHIGDEQFFFLKKKTFPFFIVSLVLQKRPPNLYDM